MSNEFRAPAVPLVGVDPFFSIWSAADCLTDAETSHWAGAAQPLSLVVEVDGAKFRLLGASPAEIAALPQVSCAIHPTQTVVCFAGSGVEAELRFSQAATPDDLDVFSRPVTYVTLRVRKDGKPAAASARFAFSGSTATNDDAAVSEIRTASFAGLSAVGIGRAEQTPLAYSGDRVRCDWGYAWAVFAADAVTGLSQPGDGGRLFASALKAFAEWRIPASGETHFMLAYDDVKSLRVFDYVAPAWWRRNGKPFEAMLAEAEAAYPALLAKLDALDAELEADFLAVGGVKYAKLAALAWRQSFAACKLVADPNGEPLYFSKENASNGCIGTVDVFYPQLPHLLLTSPTLVKATLAPILLYAESGRWPYPYAPHDLGQYPLAVGQVYSMGPWHSDAARMPVEECGNMLLCLGALSKLEGNADFASRWWPSVTKWAQYLETQGFDPENQLCTDDFAGHLAHNANLSVKAILALRAYAMMAGMRGEKEVADRYAKLAEGMVPRWMEAAAGGAEGAYRLAFDQPGTWSQKYNLVWDRLLGFNLFPKSVRDAETKAYVKLLNAYGLPLDSRRAYTKSDWTVWSATLADDRADFDAIIGALYRFADESPSRIPFTDWYQTDSALHVGFIARSVIGGLMIPLLYDDALARKYASRDKTSVGAYAPVDPPRSAIGKALEPYVGEGNLMPGAVSVVWKDGKYTVDCLGVADLKTKAPMLPSTMFWAASMSKGVCVAALLTVVDEGRIGLDDPVAKYIPGFHAEVTVRHVLSHMSGLPFFPAMPIDAKPVLLLASLAAREPLQSRPGTKYCYSNWGIDVAMAVMETVTGEPFDKTVKERVLDPLGMVDTTFWPTQKQVDRMTKLYFKENEEAPFLEKTVDQCQTPYTLPSRYPEAGGGLFSTALDMARFYRMVAEGGRLPDGSRLLSEAVFKEWAMRQTPADAESSYSFGMSATSDGWMAHGGSGGTQGRANWKTGVAQILFVQMHGQFKAFTEIYGAWGDACRKYFLV